MTIYNPEDMGVGGRILLLLSKGAIFEALRIC